MRFLFFTPDAVIALECVCVCLDRTKKERKRKSQQECPELFVARVRVSRMEDRRQTEEEYIY